MVQYSKARSDRKFAEWEKALSQFDFVFHVPLRHVDPSRINITDMICHDILGMDTVLHQAVKEVLSSDRYRCFIIMDSLDEWKPDQTAINRLKFRGMPNQDNMSNCVIFTTMRPWKLSEVHGVCDDDRVIEIQGLDHHGIKSVIEKVLVHYNKLKQDTIEYKTKHQEIISKLKSQTMYSFLKIPLLAVVCVQIWYEGTQIGDGMTSFYLAMVNMLIQRAHLKLDIQKQILYPNNVSVPKIMFATKNIRNYFKVLLKLGKVSYEGLLSKEMKLVFKRDELETEIGEEELRFALDVGLISQRDVHSALEEKVSVQFFHKSIQEFLAAIYIVTLEEASDSFCKQLYDIKVVMELSNVIMFICGMCPSLGSVISQRVARITDNDTNICDYRESPFWGNRTVMQLFELQVSWHSELQHGQKANSMTDSPVTFHISDVHLNNSDIETELSTWKLLSDPHTEIGSLCLFRVSTDGNNSMTNTVLNNFLCNTNLRKSTFMVFIEDYKDGCFSTISLPSLRYLRLHGVIIQDNENVHNLPILSDCESLQILYLTNVTLGDRELGLTPRMSRLLRIRFLGVNMTELMWDRWLQSIIGIQHQFVVIICGSNIDRRTMSTIRSSPHLSVTRDYRYEIEFTRVWPLTQDTQ